MGFASLKKTKKRIVCQESKPVAGVDVLMPDIFNFKLGPYKNHGISKTGDLEIPEPCYTQSNPRFWRFQWFLGEGVFFCGQITWHFSHLSIQYLQLSRLNTLSGKACMSDIYVSRSQAPKRHPGKQSGDFATSRPMPPACRISLRK